MYPNDTSENIRLPDCFGRKLRIEEAVRGRINKKITPAAGFFHFILYKTAVCTGT